MSEISAMLKPLLCYENMSLYALYVLYISVYYTGCREK